MLPKSSQNQAKSTSLRMRCHPIQINETCQDEIGDGALLKAKGAGQEPGAQFWRRVRDR